jgi:hypothetical protein
MNKKTKITLLVTAMVLAVVAVMAYCKTIVSPPGKLKFMNQYVAEVKRDIAKVAAAPADDDLDEAFYRMAHELGYLHYNELVTNKEYDELLADGVNKYVPKFATYCNNKFAESSWNEHVLEFINRRATELQGLTTTSNTNVVKGENATSLINIHTIIVNYYEAKRASYASGYRGLQSAKERIATAKRYAKMSPINNCTSLVNRLNNVARKLERAHYAYLSHRVELLANYDRYYYKSDYDRLAENVYDELNSYKTNARSVYGSASNISGLENRAGSYYNYACSYFNN